jgi:hypothetical protein
MNYVYSELGFVKMPTISPEKRKQIENVVRAAKRGALKIQIKPFVKGFPVNFWRTVKRDDRKRWVTSQLSSNELIKVAQRAGILPLRVITVPSVGDLPAQRYALYSKYENPVYGTGTVKLGVFQWDRTDIFKKERSVYRIDWDKGARDFFIKKMQMAKIKTDANRLWSQSQGKGDSKQTIKANVVKSKKYLELHRVTGSPGWTFTDFAVWSTFPVAKMNDYILDKTAPLIEAFGELLGSVLDVVAAAAGLAPAFIPGVVQSPEAQYRKPNYLLWGGVAVGIVAVAVVVKKRKTA